MPHDGKRVTGDNRAAVLARDLRRLAGDRKQAFIAKEAGLTAKTVSVAFKGAELVGWDTMTRILLVLGVTEHEQRGWKTRYDEAKRSQTAFASHAPKSRMTGSSVAARLWEVMEELGVTAEHLRAAQADATPPQVEGEPVWHRPSPVSLDAFIAGDEPPCNDVAILVMAICEAPYATIDAWRKQFPVVGCSCAADAEKADAERVDAARAAVAVPGPPELFPAPGPSIRTPRIRPRWVWIGALVVIPAVLIVLGVALTRGTPRRPVAERSNPGASSSPSDQPDPRDSVPASRGHARKDLRALASRVARNPDPQQIGHIAYIRTVFWQIDENSAADEPVSRRAEHLWRYPDGTARQVVVRYRGDGQSATLAAPAQTRTFQRSQIPTGELQLSTDPGMLAEQLRNAVPGIATAAAILQSVAQVYRYHCLDAAQRAAVLVMLADGDGLVTSSDAGFDREGREGLEVMATAKDGLQYRALFHLDDGSLLSLETIRLSPPGEPMAVPSADSTLFYGCEHRSTID